MSPRKRMGNDPFESSPYKEANRNESKPAPLDKKTPVVKAKAGFKYADETGQIIIKLDLAEQNIAAQKEEIELLRKELNELKNRVIFYKNSPFNYWLRFWFPWFPR